MTYLISGILCLLCAVQTEFTEYLNLIPDSRVAVDYGPAVAGKPVALVIYALPNGNTIEWTAGKRMEPEDDWHYDIQHIKAQTEFVRAADITRQYIVAYLQASMKAWTTHSAIYAGEKSEKNPQGLSSYTLYPALVDSLERMVEAKTGRPVAEIILSSHSGGGRFMFNYIAGLKEIPQKVSRLAFIDSNYGFEEALHTGKLAGWLKRDTSHKLAVISYVDTTVILNGKPIVSRTGGAERLHSLLFCTPLEEKNYKFWSEERAYGRYIR